MRYVTALLLLLLFAVPAAAETEDVYNFDTMEQEMRFQTLIAELRCPKCQNQNIADSNAPISKDMREAVYRMMQDGADNREITEAMVARFGEFVRYKPEVDRRTILLWATPAIAVLIGLIVVASIIIRSRRNDISTALTEEEKNKVSRILSDQDSGSS